MPYGLVLQVAAVVVLLGTALGYGAWRLGQNDFLDGPRLSLLQGNLEQSVRNANGKRVREHYNWLAVQAAQALPKNFTPPN